MSTRAEQITLTDTDLTERRNACCPAFLTTPPRQQVRSYEHESITLVKYANGSSPGEAQPQAIRPPQDSPHSLPDLKVKRQPAFCQERLEARTKEIGWVLTETDINIMSRFERDTTDEIAERVNRRSGTVRTDLSARIFLFLQLLSGRKKIPNKKVAFQIMLEYGIFECR
jgi:hypothetical protein